MLQAGDQHGRSPLAPLLRHLTLSYGIRREAYSDHTAYGIYPHPMMIRNHLSSGAHNDRLACYRRICRYRVLATNHF